MIPLGVPARRVELFQLDTSLLNVAITKDAGVLESRTPLPIHLETSTLPVIVAKSAGTLRQVTGPGWYPTRIGASSWFDASDSSKIIEGTGGVSTWQDRTANAYHITQSNSSYRPAWYSGLTIYTREVQFAILDYLLYGAKTWAQNCSGFTVAALVKVNPGGNNYLYLIQTPTSAVRFAITVYSDGFSGRISVGARRQDAGALSSINTTFPYILPYPSTFIFVAQVQYTPAALIAIAVNGTIFSQATGFNIGNCENTTPNSIRMGDGIQTSGSSYRDVKELFVFNRSISTTERQQSEGYLAHRWGVTSLLPSSHPYKSSPPT